MFLEEFTVMFFDLRRIIANCNKVRVFIKVTDVIYKKHTYFHEVKVKWGYGKFSQISI